jgi:hypothetical protein
LTNSSYRIARSSKRSLMLRSLTTLLFQVNGTTN